MSSCLRIFSRSLILPRRMARYANMKQEALILLATTVSELLQLKVGYAMQKKLLDDTYFHIFLQSKAPNKLSELPLRTTYAKNYVYAEPKLGSGQKARDIFYLSHEFRFAYIPIHKGQWSFITSQWMANCIWHQFLWLYQKKE
ncbi:unnamed protein product [Fraxinus pennsylvanica]|uniref:Uncharacterized protein n=1 Tax=Fraxinus pennsylvanica TaxID=56036 RepID=A0AAD2A762_9LAMI|nr:unnamed protein product [Fraxinus pennsylvanica]